MSVSVFRKGGTVAHACVLLPLDRYWMLGTSSVFLIFGLYLAHVVAARWVADLKWGFSGGARFSLILSHASSILSLVLVLVLVLLLC